MKRSLALLIPSPYFTSLPPILYKYLIRQPCVAPFHPLLNLRCYTTSSTQPLTHYITPCRNRISQLASHYIHPPLHSRLNDSHPSPHRHRGNCICDPIRWTHNVSSGHLRENIPPKPVRRVGVAGDSIGKYSWVNIPWGGRVTEIENMNMDISYAQIAK